MASPRALGLGLIAARKIGDDDVTLRQLERGAHQGAETVDDHVRQRTLTKNLRAGIVEIRRELVQENQGGLITDDFLPLNLVSSLGAIHPIGLDGFFLLLAESQSLPRVGAKVRMSRQQTQRNHHMHLTVPHCLGKLEDCLVRLA